MKDHDVAQIPAWYGSQCEDCCNFVNVFFGEYYCAAMEWNLPYAPCRNRTGEKRKEEKHASEEM